VKLFRLCILHSVSILVPDVAGEGLPCSNAYVRSVATRVLIYYMVGLVWRILCHTV
jgi:hypothetical protein